MPRIRYGFAAFALACWLIGLCAGLRAQAPALDVLLFKDGDKVTGQLVRVQRGSILFRSFKMGEVSVDFDHIADLTCSRRFAVLIKGAPVSKKNAVIGKLEVFEDRLVVTPEAGLPYTLKAADVAYAIDDDTFEREVARKVLFHEGWSSTISLGGSFVHSTEDGKALTTNFSLTRAIPGVPYLPRRHSTSIGLRDKYEFIRTPDATGVLPATESESHTFHADFERNEYFHSRFYALANYSFDRNYSQGLLAEQLYGGGLGWTVIKSGIQTLDLKTDIHRATQGFTDPTNNDSLVGQKLVLEYERSLPANLTLRSTTDYLPSYNLPHKYSANATVVITVPIYRRLGISFTTTDNYLNNPVAGRKRNTFQFDTSITFSHEPDH